MIKKEGKMAESKQTMDDMIVCLMSMGFDITACQDAIEFGKHTVESAVEWLVAGKPGFRQTSTAQSEAPNLRLRPATSSFETSSAAYVKPKPIPLETTTGASSTSADQSEAQKPETHQSESGVVSRLHLSDTQRKYKEGFEQKKRDEAKKEALLEKRRHKEEHARVLKEIADDREMKKLTSGSCKVSPDADSPRPKEQKIETKSTERQTGTCLLQIRLPDGSSLRQSFGAMSTLQEVWDFTLTKHNNLTGYSFIQPFPRHEFTSAEMLQSVSDLKLTPTGSLVLQKKQVPATQPLAMDISESLSEVEVSEMPQTPPAAPSAVHSPSAHYRWGQGHSLETENLVNDDADETAQDDEEVMDEEEEGGPNIVIPGMGLGGNMPPMGIGGNMPPMGVGGNMPPMGIGGNMPPMGMGGNMPPMGNIMGQANDIFGMQVAGHGNQQAFGGVGQRLVPVGHPDQGEVSQQRSMRELAFERAQARLAQPAADGPSASPTASSNLPSPTTPVVTSLLTHCLKHITHRLNDPRHQLLSLSGISEEMAQMILNYLIKEKQLKPRTLNPFLPCYLRKLVLDCYPYATNELLHAIRLHTNVSHLSLSSCPLITDAGMQHLSKMKNVKKLNLSSCKQLSNKCVNVLAKMEKLVSLNLEDTGISDQGVIEFLSSQPEHIQYLNLNRTSVTQAIYPHLHTCAKQLKSLSLEDTKVVSLSGIQEMKNLESLNVARTAIVTESLLCLVNLPRLVSLNIANTENLNGDNALEQLKGLSLHTLLLPCRLTTTNTGIQCLSGFPLTALDLTNYIYVGDEGMEYIGKLISLKKLLLSNTKLTDTGMVFLESLSQLEVLNIDRTFVTDEGASIIGAFTNLVELSMASTGITTKYLMSGSLNSCSSLIKLNLSKTRITNKGVLNLSLPFLQMLSLDSTKVLPTLTVTMVTGCPSLTQMSARNLEVFTRDDEVEEADMQIDT